MTEATTQAGTETVLVPGTPEYDAKMAETFRSSQSSVGDELAGAFGDGKTKTDEGDGKPVKPENVPDKFWDAEKGVVRTDELLKSYTELEAGKGKTPTEEKPVVEQTAEEKAAAEAVDKAGLKWDDLATKIATKGSLDESDYAALEKAGIPKNLTDEFIGLRKEAQDRATVDAMSYIGGSQDPTANSKATAELLEWAAKSLTPGQVEGYNKMLAGADWKVAVDTLKTLKGQATKTDGEPQLLNLKGGAGGAVIGYQTQDEQRADMAKPLYNEMSPAGENFRAEVMNKTRLAAWRR